MAAKHKDLLKVLRRTTDDFQPWGRVDRDNPEWKPDCSCGCKFFQPIEGDLGMDWGVCYNPISPRAGMLTFEHQGCPYFEYDTELDKDDTDT